MNAGSMYITAFLSRLTSEPLNENSYTLTNPHLRLGKGFN